MKCVHFYKQRGTHVVAKLTNFANLYVNEEAEVINSLTALSF